MLIVRFIVKFEIDQRGLLYCFINEKSNLYIDFRSPSLIKETLYKSRVVHGLQIVYLFEIYSENIYKYVYFFNFKNMNYVLYFKNIKLAHYHNYV